MEEWRPLPLEPKYEISSHGRIRRAADKRLLSPYRDRGYLTIVITTKGRRRFFRVHRLVAMTFLGPAPSPNHVVAHRDGNGFNNQLSNIRWSTEIGRAHV